MKKSMLKVINGISCLALALALVLTAVSLLGPRQATAAWDGTAATAFQSGSGTASSPYVIATEAQLGLFIRSLANGTQYSGQYLVLAKDMDMTGHTWTMNSTFLGHFDGRGYTVTADCGLLWTVGEGATIQGLNYVLSQVEDRYGICGYNNGTLTNCVVMGNLDGDTLGMLCWYNYGTVTGCGGIGNVDAYGPSDSDAYAGLIVHNYGTVASCFSGMTLEASAPGKYDYAYVGPITARNYTGGAVTDCIYDKELYTGTVTNAVGLTTQEMMSSLALGYLVSSSTPYCGWTLDAAFNGYPHLQHLAHNYTAYVTGYKGQDEVFVNGTGTYVSLSNTGSGTIYYSTDPAVTDPAKFSAYSENQAIFLSGDATISMAVKYSGSFGAVTRQRFIALPGSGTESNPYKITQNYQLPLIAKFPEAHFVLGADLTFTEADYASDGCCPGGWTCIPTFSGVLDGKGHTITGLKGIGGGIIGTNEGTVTHILLKDHKLYGTGSSFGAIVNYNKGTVSYCYTKSAWTLTDLPSVATVTFGPTVGGVVGDNAGTVSYCRNDGIVAVTRNVGYDEIEIGGIVGYSGGRDVIGCVNTGTLVVRSTATVDGLIIGGIAGGGRVYDSKAVQTMDVQAALDYPSYAAGIASRYANSSASRCVSGYTIVGGSTSAQKLYQYAYVGPDNGYTDCYQSSVAQLPEDCEGLTFDVGGSWWVSNEGLLPQGVISADGHAWVLMYDQLLPNCTAKGDAQLYCAICGEGKTDNFNLQTISALGHRYTTYTSNGDATCSADGTKTAQCDRACGQSKTVTDEGSMLDHSFTDKPSGTEATAASCTAAQTQYVQCDNCNAVSDTLTVAVDDPLDHSFNTQASQTLAEAASCDSAAKYYVKCDDCTAVSDTLTVSVGDPLTHEWKAATCSAPETCGLCGDTQGEAAPDAHDWVEANCVAPKTCSLCELTEGEALPNGHSFYLGKCEFCENPGGQCGGALYWILKDGTLTVYGTGTMYDYDSENPGWYNYRAEIEAIVMEDGAANVGTSAFRNCTALTSLEIPASVTEIKGYAFYNCSALEVLALPDTLTSLGWEAFSYAAVKEFKVPDGLTEIVPFMFYHWEKLETVTFHENVTAIGKDAFLGCSALESIDLPEGLVSIGERAFDGAGLTSLKIPASVTTIGSRAIACPVAELTVPAGLESVAKDAFSLAQNAEIYFAGADTQWYGYSLSLYKDERVHFQCAGPEGHWEDKEEPVSCTADGRTYELCACGYERNEQPGEPMTGHDWADANCIAPETCGNCGDTQGEPLPNGHSFADGVCLHCGKLGGQCGDALYWVLDGEGTLTVYGTGTMYPYVSPYAPWYSRRTEIRSLVVESGAESIGKYAFYNCTELVSVSLPAGLTTVEVGAFSGCAALTGLTLPESVTTVGASAFSGCSGLKSLTVPAGVKTLGDYVFQNSGLESVQLPEGLTGIGKYAFKDCAALAQIQIPANVTAIGDWAFAGCTALKSVSLPVGLQTLGNSAFRGCTGLESVSIPDSLAELPQYAFYGCTGLKQLVIPASVTSIGANAFGSSGVTDVYYGGTRNAWDASGASAEGAYLHIGCTQPAGHWSERSFQGSCTEDAYTYDGCDCGHKRNVNITKPAPGHSWKAATCTAPKTCSTCKATEGSAKGHSWKAATCTAPKTCSTCKATEGSANGHSWKTATCTAPKTCSTCKATEGSANGHKWTAATCTAPKTCSACKATEGSANGHSWKAATCTTAKTCTTCNATSGSAKGHNWLAATCIAPEKCDSCGTTRGSKIDHWDTTPRDHKCDGCGCAVGTHTDGPYWDHKCDYCGGYITECTEGLYKDHKCDGCGKTLSSCTDADKNHTCDYCGVSTGGCVDKNLDHNCDVCGVYDGKHSVDSNKDHKCDVCGKVMGTCSEGAVVDHKCDVCGKLPPNCGDADKNHTCDNCGLAMGICNEDKNSDHKCDYCGKVLTAHSWKEATCIGPKSCVYCFANEGGPKGHSWNGGVITQMPTDTEPGIRTFTCTDCGMTENRRFTKVEPTVTGANRLAGSDRYKTAFLAADMLKAQLGVEKFTTIVIASGTEFADALSGSYLAAVKNAPMLLVRNNKATIALVREYVNANLAPGGTVYILGGVNAVPKAMETGLNTANVFRLGGNTRYDTNLLILKEAGVGDKDILVCTGKGFADSLSASAAERPILLVKDSFTSAQKDFLKAAKGKLYIIGGTSAVSAKVETALKAYGEVKRLGGNTRYETSVLVAQEFFDKPTAAVLAYAQNFPDGLSGGALAAAMDSPLILTASGKDAAAAKYAKSMGIDDGYILGGGTLINDKAVKNIFSVTAIK